jgi:hypothetical protein
MLDERREKQPSKILCVILVAQFAMPGSIQPDRNDDIDSKERSSMTIRDRTSKL